MGKGPSAASTHPVSTVPVSTNPEFRDGPRRHGHSCGLNHSFCGRCSVHTFTEIP